jgi:hypothetical protein
MNDFSQIDDLTSFTFESVYQSHTKGKIRPQLYSQELWIALWNL